MTRMGLTAVQVRQLMARQDVATPVPKGKRLPSDLNRLEREFLEILIGDPHNVDVWPHGIRLVLGDNDRYEPDFLVMRASGELVIYEVKAQWSNGQRGLSDSREKCKTTATIFPFTVIIASKKPKKSGGGWHYEVFEPKRRHVENRQAPADTST